MAISSLIAWIICGAITSLLGWVLFLGEEVQVFTVSLLDEFGLGDKVQRC